MDVQIRSAHQGIDAVERLYGKTCLNLLQSTVNKFESSYSQVRLFAGEKEVEKIQQCVFLKKEVE